MTGTQEVQAEVTTLPEKVIATDKRLTEGVNKNQAALGKLRYEWCVTKGMKRALYAELVGVTPQAVNQAIARHMKNNGLAYSPKAEGEKRGRGRPAGSTSKAKKERTYAGKPIEAKPEKVPTFSESILEMETEAVELIARAKASGRLSGRERTKAVSALRKLERHISELHAILGSTAATPVSDSAEATSEKAERHLASVSA